MLNIVLPMAGRGSRFAAYPQPKPLIPIHGLPMIALAIASMRPTLVTHRFVFLALREHLENAAVADVLRQAAPGCEIVSIDTVTQGAACTVLLAKRFIDNDEPLMIANCDQYVDVDMDRYLSHMTHRQADGLIMTFPAAHPKWSYAKLDTHGHVTQVVEKQVVSQEATVGIYNFRRGSDFVRAAETMIGKEFRVNGEFYVAPVYNELIANERKVVVFNIGEGHMYGLGEPADLEHFRALPMSRHAAERTRS